MMAYVQQLPEKAGDRPLHNSRSEARGVVRNRSGCCLVVGDPAGFVVNLERELGRMRRYGDSSCLLMVAADAPVEMTALDFLGSRFSANLRSYDSLCRYGANHFLILLPHVKGADVPGVVRRLRVQVAGYAMVLADGSEDFVTATIGGAMLDPDASMNENIDRAATACRAVRRDGGNDHRMWAPGLENTKSAITTDLDA